MACSDYFYRFVFEDFAVRGEFVRLESSWQALQDRHEYSDAVKIELGKSLAAVTLLSGTIKFKGSLTLQLQSAGVIKGLVAQATEKRTFRGMARFSDDQSDQPILGDGRLILTAEAPNGEKYQSFVALAAGDISAALENYFAQSEQLQTRLWLACNHQHAVGLFLQKMPGESKDENWQRVSMLAETIKDNELFDLDVEEILLRLFHQEQVRLFEPEPVAFRCSCNRERIENTLLSMGRTEVESILKEQGQVTADCEFCNAQYRFDSVDIGALFAGKTSINSPITPQ